MKNTTIPENSIQNCRNGGKIDIPGIHDHPETILKVFFFFYRYGSNSWDVSSFK